MTAAAISGNYAEFKLVKTRGVFAITIEFPVERTADVFAALGYPQPGTEIPVAVARLNNAQNADTISDNAHRREVMPPATARPGGTNRTVIDTPPSSQTLGAGAGGLPAVIAAQAAEGAASTGGGEDAGGRTQQPVPRHPQGSSTTAAPVVCNPVAPEGDENRGACDHAFVRGRDDGMYCEKCGMLIHAFDPEVADGKRAVKRAVMLCKDPEFQRWVGNQIAEKYGTLSNGHIASEAYCAQVIHARCQIASRADLAHDERARKAFEALVTEYDLWRGRIAEVRG